MLIGYNITYPCPNTIYNEMIDMFYGTVNNEIPGSEMKGKEVLDLVSFLFTSRIDLLLDDAGQVFGQDDDDSHGNHPVNDILRSGHRREYVHGREVVEGCHHQLDDENVQTDQRDTVPSGYRKDCG
jgi:hypothetical protein